MEEENMREPAVPSVEAEVSETVTTPHVTEPSDEQTTTTATTTTVVEVEQNGNCNSANKSNGNSKNNNRNNNNNNTNFNVKNKKLNNRRRKRSYRSRKNSRSGGNNFFNAKKRDVLFDQARRHQLFFSDSQRLVPYNTNEFLMDDHYPKVSPNFNYNPSNSHDSFSSSDCGMSGSIDEDEFLTKEFRMDYENLRSEQLHEMTKDQLIQEYLKLENQTELSIKAKENEISTLNNKIKELTRRLKRNKKAQQNGEYSSDSSSSSDSSGTSDSSSSSSDSEIENGDNDFPVINDTLEQLAETVSC